MKAFLGLLLILLSTVSYSQGYDYNQKTFKLAEVELLSTEASQYQCGFCAHRNPYVPEQDNKWRYGLKHTTKIDVLKTKDFNLNLDSDFFLDGVEQVKYVGMDYELSFRYRGVEIGRAHHSSHQVDEANKQGTSFPLTDKYIIRFNWIKK